MSLTFGPKVLLGNPKNATSVKVETWDGKAAALSAPVIINEQGEVSFTVSESGLYRINVRGPGDVFSILVSLSDGPDFDTSNIRSMVDWLVTQVLAGGGGGSGGPIVAANITDASTVGKSVLTAANAAAARSAIGAGTSSLAIGTTSGTAADAAVTTSALSGKAASTHTHAKADVGLSNVDNTSDSAKPVSTATQTALNAKAATSHTHTKSEVGLSNVDNTSDAAKPVSTATQAAINAVSARIVVNPASTTGLTNGTLIART